MWTGPSFALLDLERIMDDLSCLRNELNQTKDRVLKIETYFKVAFAVAAIFGLAGAFGANIISSINEEIVMLNAGKNQLVKEIGVVKADALAAIHNATGKSVEAISLAENDAVISVGKEVSDKMSNFLSTAETLTLYRCPVGTGGWNPGGVWGSYGCEGQISTHSQCTNIEYPNTQRRECSKLGTFKLLK